MPNPNTPNEPIYPSCPNGYLVPCYCPACVIETTRLHRAEAAASAQETAAREREEIIAARRASNDESDRLRTYLKDCDCRCCEARSRLRAISYERAERSPAEIHGASSDRRDYPSDPATLVRGSDEERRAAEAYRIACESRRHPCEIVRAAAKVRRESPDTGAGPAGPD